MPNESPIFAYLQKPSMVDFPKRFAAVFFTSGCNFSCGFCHNASLMGGRRKGLSWENLETACAQFRNDWVNGAVITGGEPTLSSELPALLRFFKERFGFATKLDTNGSNPERLAECLPYTDYVAMDIKTGLSAYAELAGFPNTEKIKQSAALIKSAATDYEFRTTVIETVHTDEHMEEVGNLLSGAKRFVLQAFIPRDNLPDPRFPLLPRTPSSRLHELKNRMTGCADEIILRGA